MSNRFKKPQGDFIKVTTANQNLYIQPDPEVEKEKKTVQEMLEQIKIKQKNIKHLEKEKRLKRFQRIGEIADEMGIIHLDDDVLRGAFCEIASKINDVEQLTIWKHYELKKGSEIDE